MTEKQDSTSNEEPYCRTESGKVKVTLPDGEGGCVVGELSPEEARSLTLGLRSTAAEIDGKPFFDGGWSTAEAVRYAASELEELEEQFEMRTRNLQNADCEAARMGDQNDGE